MATKGDFTPQEWQLLMESVMAAAVAVTAAQPSGLIGILQEGFASASALTEAKKDPRAGDLIRAIVADFETSQGRTIAQDSLRKRFEGAKPGEVKERSIDVLRQASALLDAKAPAEAAAFKSWLREIGQRVAAAASEGGFLGFGGVAVSDAEKATLGEINQALAIAA